uniref:C2 domain-containing protein n=1 Tax=Hyaloperonospora arabidopsidis (strain Emoy2) TaxID=559515 RepID=M4BVB2_HYAAE
MSAVDDVEARIRRLDELRVEKSTQLRQLQQELRYNSVTGVDERLQSGQSVAQLDVSIEGGRNLLFKAGFLSSPQTYVRVTLVLVVAQLASEEQQTLMEQKSTSKRPVAPSPRWSETLSFQTLPAAVGTLRVDVMQEERIGADEVVGAFLLPLSRLQDQRPMDKWHVLQQTRDGATTSEVFVSCRLQRSPLSALTVELELLQNQANELQVFLGRHQNLVTGLPQEGPRPAMSSANVLQGKVVVPEETPECSVSTRFSAVASFPPAMRKREFGENTDVTGGLLETLRAKRQRVNSEQHVGSLSDRIANWLLPTSTPTSSMKSDARPYSGVFAGENGGMTSGQFFPFKHRQSASESRRGRRTGRSLSTAEPKAPSTLQAIEKWLFTNKSGNS